jgi:RNA polymerase sporulation-specific sigma factor
MFSNEELFMSGDIENLYKSNKNLMFHIANKFLNLNLEYDELMECGDLAFVKAIKIFNPNKSKWATYFSKVMVNEILMVNRKKNREVDTISIETAICEDSDNNVLTIQDVIPATKDTLDEAINLIVTEEILIMARKLSLKKREVLRLYLIGKKQKDIGQALSLSQSYVSRLIKNICLELKITYEKGA